MLNTYLNDNQNMSYPFYGNGSLPFAMSVITGLSICLQTEATVHQPLFVSSIVIDKDSVRLAVCRCVSDTDDTKELVGMFYANLAGYYTYIPSYISDAVYEDQTITPEMLRFVFADYSPNQATEVVSGGTTYTTEMDDIIENMQVFYSYVQANVGTILGKVTSHGHIQLGSIPEAAIGSYFGEFYLDPSCVTYMPDSVYGYHAAYTVNQDTYPAKQTVEIAVSGLLTTSDNGDTVVIDTTYDADEADLVDLEFSTRSRISRVNGYEIKATRDVPKPYLRFNDLDDKVKWTAKRLDSAVIIELNGTDDFPNCYGDN